MRRRARCSNGVETPLRVSQIAVSINNVSSTRYEDKERRERVFPLPDILPYKISRILRESLPVDDPACQQAAA
jgi:hypothetical protein